MNYTPRYHSISVFLALLVSFSFPLFSTGVLNQTTYGAERSSGDDLMKQGKTLFESGRFEQAALTLTEAGKVFEQQNQLEKQTEALIYLSQALFNLGQYQKAGVTLEFARELAERSNNNLHHIMILGRLGNVAFALGQTEPAKQYLTLGLSKARELEHVPLTASLLNDLGNVLASQEQYSEALGAFTESTILAEAIDQRSLAVTALINAAWSSLLEKKYEDAQNRLDLAWTQVQALDNSHEKSREMLNIGLAYDRLRLSLQPSNEAFMRRAGEAFQRTAEVAQGINDPRMVSYGWGYLGHLYEEEGRIQEALDLTRQAIQSAQQANALESLYRWEWQVGRILTEMGKTEDAILAYRRAMYSLQPIRTDLTAGFQSRSESFGNTVGPLFFELVDLLLKQADSQGSPQDQQPFLLQARETVEQFKTAELQDYFRDDCVQAARSREASVDEIIEEFSQTTAVVYPILLPDRIELLLSYHNGEQRELIREAVPVSSQVLTQEVRTFRRFLEKRTTREYLPHAQGMYKRLIEPIQHYLETFHVDTIVFVPDGPLRTIPMAALHDGESFLIQRYALAITPGIILTDPQPIDRKQIKLLSVALSDSIQGFPSLPNVTSEVKTIQDLYGGKVLLNKQFQVDALELEMKDDQPTIVHIASHAKFESDAQKTFLLTFDGKLTMDRLDRLVGLYQFRDSPLDLLTLSACETAAGDDRAALGLAGVAIKAGARSALATLWFINDKATSNLVTDFYRQLQDPSLSKAVALQHAQQNILQDPSYQHPGYWSPFLMINNWL